MHQFLPIQSVQQAMDLDMICNHWPTLPKHEKTTNGYHRAKYHIQNDRDDYTVLAQAQRTLTVTRSRPRSARTVTRYNSWWGADKAVCGFNRTVFLMFQESGEINTCTNIPLRKKTAVALNCGFTVLLDVCGIWF